MYKNGFLPNNNGWFSQPNKFIQMMTFIDQEIIRHQREMEEKNGRK